MVFFSYGILMHLFICLPLVSLVEPLRRLRRVQVLGHFTINLICLVSDHYLCIVTCSNVGSQTFLMYFLSSVAGRTEAAAVAVMRSGWKFTLTHVPINMF